MGPYAASLQDTRVDCESSCSLSVTSVRHLGRVCTGVRGQAGMTSNCSMLAKVHCARQKTGTPSLGTLLDVDRIYVEQLRFTRKKMFATIKATLHLQGRNQLEPLATEYTQCCSRQSQLTPDMSFMAYLSLVQPVGNKS